MLIEQFTKITSQGAKLPFIFWADEFKDVATQVLPSLRDLHEKVGDGTDTKKNLARLVKVMEGDSPNEFELAKALLHLSVVFLNNTPKEKQEIVNEFIASTKDFYGRSQTAELFTRERESLLKKFSEKRAKAQDLMLFQNEGMTYCLEFYLALYKAIQDAGSDEDKRGYIENKEIDLGFGGAPGLRVDFEHDEVLTKFIHKVLDNDLRNNLTKGYYDTKLVVVDEEAGLDDILASFKSFLKLLLKTFPKVGIDRLSSAFFKPYGESPLLDEIQL